MATQRRSQGGRPSKGARDPLLTRVPPGLADAVRISADAQGLTVNDYLANLLAREHGFAPVVADANAAQMMLTA
jgi:predicted HicB family RNase H-like nuclease